MSLELDEFKLKPLDIQYNNQIKQEKFLQMTKICENQRETLN